MSVRPALTAIGCRGCRQVLLRTAVHSFSASLPRANQRMHPSFTFRPRCYSDLPKTQSASQNPAAEIDSHESKQTDEILEDEEEAPWFLEEEPPRHVPSLHKATLPKAPEDGPAIIEPMIKYIYEDMGLDDISLLDLRELDPPASLGPNLIMLCATARSERHLHISAGRFVRWLRRNHDVDASADGLIGPGELKTKLRRLRKKAKLMGSNSAILPGGDHGISTGWVCVNFSLHGQGHAEAAVFDDSGKFSGFGSAQTGTTVVIQCMTEPRREELDLELLWRGVLKRNLEQQTKVRGESGVDASNLEKMLASRLQLHTSPSKMQWEALQQASEQQRRMSTARTPSRWDKQAKGAPLEYNGSLVANMYSRAKDASVKELELRRMLESVLYGGDALDHRRLQELILTILGAPLSSSHSAADRLAWVDSLLRTTEERGLEIESTNLLVLLIEAIVRSPAYGPELTKAQQGLEILLRESHEPPTEEHTLALMNAYAFREDWDRVWDAFRVPPRFNRARSPRLYELAYRLIASTSQPRLCRDALRWIYPEMLLERPAVSPVGELYRWLKMAILVADPLALTQLKAISRSDMMDEDNHTEEMSKVPEFARILAEVEHIRSQLQPQDR